MRELLQVRCGGVNGRRGSGHLGERFDDERVTFFRERDVFTNFQGGLRRVSKLVHGLTSYGVDFDDIASRDGSFVGARGPMKIGP